MMEQMKIIEIDELKRIIKDNQIKIINCYLYSNEPNKYHSNCIFKSFDFVKLRDHAQDMIPFTKCSFINCDLSCISFINCDFSNCHFDSCTLSASTFMQCKFYGTHFIDCSLELSEFTECFMNNCYFDNAMYGLKNTIFNNCYTDGMSFSDSLNYDKVPNLPMVCPREGSFIGWKKAHNYIVKLLIPEDAKRSSGTGRKCRCNKAIVLDIQLKDGMSAKNVKCVSSDYNDKFFYTIGETVTVDDFNDHRYITCSAGIHFFMERKEAVDYYFY